MTKLVDVVREALRTKHYAYRTEKTYLHWIKQYVRFLKPVHPREAGVDGVKRFLTYLAVNRGVSFSTQNQALAALLFLYKLYNIELGQLDIVRAKKSTWLPTVLTHNEALQVIEQLNGQYRIMAQLLYGGGLRLMEVLRLRVKDVTLILARSHFEKRSLTVIGSHAYRSQRSQRSCCTWLR